MDAVQTKSIMVCEFCPENMIDKLSLYSPVQIDDWDDYVRIVKLAIDYSIWLKMELFKEAEVDNE